MSKRYESDPADPSQLAQPLHFAFSGKTAPNRFLKAAMTERLSSWDPKDHSARGIPSRELQNLYRRWGEGGLGHILTGNVMIAYDQLEAAGNPIIPPGAPFEGPRFEAFRTLAQLAKANGSLITAQVGHPGRQVEERIQSNPVSASDVQLKGDVLGMRFAKPHAATEDEIKNIVAGFAHAAEFLHKAGYDGIQLHGAHGYLLSQFLSQTTNKRTDKYGGSLENRARIILDIADAIREKVPTSTGFIVGIKINSTEFQEEGFTVDEAKVLCELLEAARFDFVELSGGTYEQLAFAHKRESTKKRESFFIEFAEKITPGLTKTKTYVTGGFKTLGAMTAALKHVDGIGLGRPVCQEPRLAKDLLESKVQGSIELQVHDNDYVIASAIAGSQIKQIGNDHEPTDMGNKQNVDAFMKDMAVWGENMKQDREKMSLYGFVDISSVKPQAYGVSATS